MRLAALCLGILIATTAHARLDNETLFFVKAMAKDKIERTKLSNAGIAIDGVFSDSVTFVATQQDLSKIKNLGIELEVSELPEASWDFPTGDAVFHNYKETNEALDLIASTYPKIASRFVIGKTVEGRELNGIRLSSAFTKDSLPTAVFVGCHHAREHLSVEIPLMIAQYLADNYGKNERVTKLLDTREVWIVPMLNPDGAEFDIATGSYKYWRKNRVKNADGSYGVDLNRNYGASTWGGEGASDDPHSDVYHGPKGFSEPETVAMRDFVRSRKKATVLLSFHTFSELVLWPWGYTYDKLQNETDRKVFETMGKQMATWNKYKPQKSSDLYLTSGDTMDWAYEELKMFAFTFELSPSSMFGGGFYPGAKVIEPVFKANIEPALYLIESAANPYATVKQTHDPLNVF